MAEGDLDGDGDLDIVMIGYRGRRVEWVENVRDGMFGQRREVDGDTGGGESAVRIADLDGDGDSDVIVASRGGAYKTRIAWYENTDGAGQFGDARIIVTDRSAITLDIADMDGDGDPDVLAGDFGPGISWYENVGGAGSTWNSHSVRRFGEVYTVRAVDIDQDGDLDTLAHEFDHTYWVENKGGGVFGATHSFASNYWAVAIEDADGDGAPDVLGNDRNGDLVLLVNDGQGAFSETILANDLGRANDVFLVDLDGDRDLDAVVSSFEQTTWLSNENGQGRFGEPVEVLNELTRSLSIFDVDNDGDQDWVTNIETVWKNDGAAGFSHFDDFNIATGISPRRVLAADLDLDGDVDVALQGQRITWWKNQFGEATFPQPELIARQTDFRTQQLEDLIDVDGDGDLDALLLAPNEDWISWRENENGEGFFGAPQFILPQGERPAWARGADLDGDGDIDVAAAFDGRLVWFENRNGRGRFSEPTVIDDVRRFRAGQVVDLDQDGDSDIVAGNVWFENTGGAVFGTARTITDGEVYAFVVTDVDGDGDLDMAYGDTAVRWVANDGAQNFGNPRSLGNVNSVSSLVAADLDADGDQDLVASSLGDQVIWYRNGGTGEFEANVLTDNAEYAVSVAITDLDGDGDLDVVVASADDHQVRWFENRPLPE